MPTIGFVDAGQWLYYRYQLLVPNANVSFAVTVLTGDPDIFISTTSPTPGWGNNNWMAANPGGDELVVAHVGDPGYANSGNPYYIGIYAYGTINASYLLTVQAQVRRRGKVARHRYPPPTTYARLAGPRRERQHRAH